MLCPLKLRATRLDSLFKKKKKVKENISVNYEEDHVSLVLSKVPAQKCFFKYFFRWFVPDELWYVIPKETSNNAATKSPKISTERGYKDLIG